MTYRRAILCSLFVAACGGDDGGPAAESSGSRTGAGSSTTADGSTSVVETSSGVADGSSSGDASSSSTTGGPIGCWEDLAIGEVEVLYDGFAGGSEGIAFGTDGRLIATTIDDGLGTLWELGADGTATPFAEVPYALGLTPRPDGGFVVASIGENMAADGAVYTVSADGDASLLAEGIDSPNFVVLANDGSVLVSDDFDTRVFRVEADGTVTTVIENVPSPNGLAYSPARDILYVASTFSAPGELTRYDVDADGLPIEATGIEILHTGMGATNDGIAVDVDGFVYVLANLRGEIWKVDGSATELQDGEIVVDGLASPASMAFGRGNGFDPCSAYVTELFGTRVVRVSLGVEGAEV